MSCSATNCSTPDAVLAHQFRNVVCPTLLGELRPRRTEGSCRDTHVCRRFPSEVARSRRSWCEDTYNVVHWTSMPRA